VSTSNDNAFDPSLLNLAVKIHFPVACAFSLLLPGYFPVMAFEIPCYFPDLAKLGNSTNANKIKGF
jgi:hypothetical protein